MVQCVCWCMNRLQLISSKPGWAQKRAKETENEIMYSDEVSLYTDVHIRNKYLLYQMNKKRHILVCTWHIPGCTKKYVPSIYFLPQLCTRFYTFFLECVHGTYQYILQKKTCTRYILEAKSMYQVHTPTSRYIMAPYYSMVRTSMY